MFNELHALLIGLTVDQRRYVVARMDWPTKKEAADAIGIKVTTVYTWPDAVERAVELVSLNIVDAAMIMAERAVAKAMSTKIKGLDSKDERVRQAVATELIEWRLGKATQKQEIENKVTIVKGYTVAASPDVWDNPDEPK